VITEAQSIKYVHDLLAEWGYKNVDILEAAPYYEDNVLFYSVLFMYTDAITQELLSGTFTVWEQDTGQIYGEW
jgi:hypothetical protein